MLQFLAENRIQSVASQRSKQCIFIWMRPYCMHKFSKILCAASLLGFGCLHIFNRLRVLSSLDPQLVPQCFAVQLATFGGGRRDKLLWYKISPVLWFTTFSWQSAGTDPSRMIAVGFVCQKYQSSVLSTFEVDAIKYILVHFPICSIGCHSWLFHVVRIVSLWIAHWIHCCEEYSYRPSFTLSFQ